MCAPSSFFPKHAFVYSLVWPTIFLLFCGCAVVKTNYSSDLAKDATVYYYLPQTVLTIKAAAKVAVVYDKDSILTDNSWVLQEGFQVVPDMIADTRDLLSLKYKPNALMDDSIRYAVNSKGLLETVHVTTEDKTASIIKQLSQAPAFIYGVPAAATQGQNVSDGGNNNTKSLIPEGGFVLIKDFTDSFSLKVSEISTAHTFIGWNLLLINEMKVQSGPKTLSADFRVFSRDVPNPITNFNNPGPKSNDLAYLLNVKDKHIQEVNGILTRPLRNISITIEPNLQEFVGSGRTTNVAIADPSKLIVIPIKRAAFVRQTNDISIADGVILTNSIHKPSSVEGFISIPINIAKSIVSIPAQLIQFRIDNTTRSKELETAKLNYNQALQQNQLYALQKGVQMDSLNLEIQKADLKNQQALEKLKVDLQTSLYTAQMAQLQTQHQLESLKQVIDSLKSQQ